MRQTAFKIAISVCSVAVITGTLLMTSFSTAAADESAVAQGKDIAFDRKLGNCLACHQIKGGDLPGNIGPPLIGMKQRYPDKDALRAQIWDATVRNPNTIMPPFGRNNILTEKQIDQVVEFIDSL